MKIILTNSEVILTHRDSILTFGVGVVFLVDSKNQELTIETERIREIHQVGVLEYEELTK